MAILFYCLCAAIIAAVLRVKFAARAIVALIAAPFLFVAFQIASWPSGPGMSFWDCIFSFVAIIPMAFVDFVPMWVDDPIDLQPYFLSIATAIVAIWTLVDLLRRRRKAQT